MRSVKKMCSTCDVKNYNMAENIPDALVMPLGTSGEIMICLRQE